jgi:tetratricopeptide (TPR) repeat protein
MGQVLTTAMPKGVIQRAYQLYRRRRFPQAVRLLESQIFRFRDNGGFYSLLGSACLYSGDLGGAESYLRRADQLQPDNVRVLLGLAAIAFRRGQIDEALQTWLRILDLDRGNRRALHALNTLRRHAAADASQLFELRDSLRIERVYPPLPADRRSWILPLCLGCAAALLLLGYFFLLPILRPRRAARPGLAEIELTSSQPALSAQGGQSEITLTDTEISAAFAQAKQYLLDYRDNLAVREVNRIMLSNASAYVKEKARMLKSFAVQPDFSTVKDPFAFADVRLNPALYADTYVVWQGKVANVLVGDKALTFDLLVGYQDERELLGLVPVTLDFAVTLEDGTAAEVLGQVRWSDGQLSLRGVSIHKLYRRS